MGKNKKSSLSRQSNNISDITLRPLKLKQMHITDLGDLRCLTRLVNIKESVDVDVWWKVYDKKTVKGKWRAYACEGSLGSIPMARLNSTQPRHQGRKLYYQTYRIHDEDHKNLKVLMEWVGYPLEKDWSWMKTSECATMDCLKEFRTNQAKIMLGCVAKASSGVEPLSVKKAVCLGAGYGCSHAKPCTPELTRDVRRRRTAMDREHNGLEKKQDLEEFEEIEEFVCQGGWRCDHTIPHKAI
jgi:hypothetical protein